MIWLVFLFMALCAAAFAALPFLAPARALPARDAAAALSSELAAIEKGVGQGDLDARGAEAARRDAQGRALKARAPASPQPGRPADKRAALMAGGALLAGAAILYGALGHPDMRGAPASAQSPAQRQLAQLTATLETRVQEAPRDADAWRALGWAYFSAERYSDSSRAYGRAVELRPESAPFQSAYGEALVGAAGGAVTPAAAAAFRAALALAPQDVRARFYLGLLKGQQGDAKAAIADWLALYHAAPAGSEAALDLRSRIEALAHEANVDVSAEFGGVEDAGARLSDQERDAMIEAMVSSLDRKLQAQPNNLEGWIRLVHARVVQGKAGEAASALARARAALAGDAAALRRLDQVAAESGLQ